MRIATAFLLTLGLATGLMAQSRPAPSVVTGTGGSVVHPATPAGGTWNPGSMIHPGGIVHPSNVIHPGGGTRVGDPAPHNGAYSTTPRSRIIYTYPVYIGGYYDTSYVPQQETAPPEPVQPNFTILYPPQQQAPVHPVIIYPSGNPDSAPPQTQPAADPSRYLIAFQDHTIYAATAYWVDGDTLHYFTTGNVHNQVSLALVDRQFTERLNKDAGVEVKLPAPAK